MTQRVPNQTFVAAVALLLILPAAASWHCRNQYQKLIYGCLFQCLLLVCANDVAIFEIVIKSIAKGNSFNGGYFRATVKLADKPNNG